MALNPYNICLHGSGWSCCGIRKSTPITVIPSMKWHMISNSSVNWMLKPLQIYWSTKEWSSTNLQVMKNHACSAPDLKCITNAKGQITDEPWRVAQMGCFICQKMQNSKKFNGNATSVGCLCDRWITATMTWMRVVCALGSTNVAKLSTKNDLKSLGKKMSEILF